MRLCQLFFVFLLFPVIAKASVTSDLAMWEQMRNSDSPSAQNVAMLAQRYPDWPGLAGMVAKIEEQKTYANLPAASIAALFTQRRPRTESGMTAYLQALPEAQARAKLASLWREDELDSRLQKMILDRFSGLLSQEDNVARLDMLLDGGNPVLATQLALRMGNVATQYTLTRIGIAKGEITSPQSLSAAYRADGRIMGEFLRKAAAREDVNAGVQIVQQMGALSAANAESLWRARHILARSALEQKRIEDAYRLANDEHLHSGKEFAESQFLSGFIALKFKREAQKALTHFMAMHQNVDSVISKSRAAYWAGRAAQALGDKAAAQRWFSAASVYPTTFFGQKSLAALGQNFSRSAVVNAPPSGITRLVDADGLLAGVRYFYEKRDESAARQFLMAAADKAGGTADFNSLYAAAERYGDRNIEVKIARKQGVAGFAPPLAGFPRLNGDEREQARMGGVSNMALVAAIVRQESEFDPMAQSGAGARGMMQLMPRTASETARKQGLAHHVDWLQTKPHHNIRLGSTYLASLLERFNGSHVLAIAAYNAGPSRVKQWIDRFGDPRTDQIATEDWIELIPVGETRNYIQRVQEGEAVYSVL